MVLEMVIFLTKLKSGLVKALLVTRSINVLNSFLI